MVQKIRHGGLYAIQIHNNITKNQTVEKIDFIFFSSARKGLGNEEFPNWNPQSEFISDEEKQEFQSFLADGTPALYFCLLVKGLNEMSL